MGLMMSKSHSPGDFILSETHSHCEKLTAKMNVLTNDGSSPVSNKVSLWPQTTSVSVEFSKDFVISN